MNKPTILIFVEGGVIQGILATGKVNVVVIEEDQMYKDRVQEVSREAAAKELLEARHERHT